MHWKDWLVVALLSLVGWLVWLLNANSLQTNSLERTGAPTIVTVDASLFRGENKLECYRFKWGSSYSCPEGVSLVYGKENHTLLIGVDPWAIAQDKSGTNLADIIGHTRCLVREAIHESDVNFREWQACEVQRVNYERVKTDKPRLRTPTPVDSLPDDRFCNRLDITRKNWRSKIPDTTMDPFP
jgi:hypothetical protein